MAGQFDQESRLHHGLPQVKLFYMPLNDDNETVACFDGLGELAGGSLREERLEYLDAALDQHGLDKAEYGW